MTLRIVRLGTPRHVREGTRIGTVRRPPRGVRKQDYARGNWYDVWFPELAPSLPLMKKALAAETTKEWDAFVRGFKREMAAPGPGRSLDLLAALSHTGDFSVGCYCENEARCHRALLKELLIARGAAVA